MDIAYIDHYDSFSFNVIDWLGDISGVSVHWVPFDNAAKMEKLTRDPLPLVLSPGPNAPEDAWSTQNLVARALGKVPILGICLGHQILATQLGGRIAPLNAPLHGDRKWITTTRRNRLLKHMPQTFSAGVYNSLSVVFDSLSSDLICAQSQDSTHEVQAIAYEPADGAPAYGLQFHPESFLSSDCRPILKAWEEILRSSSQA